MRWTLCFALAAAIAFPGCAPRETKETHILHSGETAQLVCRARTAVPVALAKPDIHTLAEAVESHDEGVIREFVRSGKAVEVETHTRVRVTGESYNERKVRIEEGPLAGRIVWVPFEWLKPV